MLTKDAVNIIAYDNATCPLSAGLLAQSTQWYIACANGDAYFEEMDLIFQALRSGIIYNRLRILTKRF